MNTYTPSLPLTSPASDLVSLDHALHELETTGAIDATNFRLSPAVSCHVRIRRAGEQTLVILNDPSDAHALSLEGTAETVIPYVLSSFRIKNDNRHLTILEHYRHCLTWGSSEVGVEPRDGFSAIHLSMTGTYCIGVGFEPFANADIGYARLARALGPTLADWYPHLITAPMHSRSDRR